MRADVCEMIQEVLTILIFIGLTGCVLSEAMVTPCFGQGYIKVVSLQNQGENRLSGKVVDIETKEPILFTEI